MLRRSFVTAPAAASAGKLHAGPPLHPRLFLDAKRLALLQRQVETTHAALWKSVRHDADSFAAPIRAS